MAAGQLVNFQKQTVLIEKVVFGGQGLARLADGLVLMVPGALPGERVEVAVVKNKNSYLQARLLSVLESSPQRVRPPCPHYPQCGGCQLQHANYELQAELKDEFLTDSLSRNYDQLAAPAYARQEFILSDQALGYRQRVRLQVDDRGRLGFFAARSHLVQEIGACLLAVPELNQVLAGLRTCNEVAALLSHARELELIFSPRDGQVIVIVELARMARAADQKTAALITERLPAVKSTWLKPAGGALAGPFGVSAPDRETSGAEQVRFSLPASVSGQTIDLCLEPEGFCQVNLQQNEKLVSLLLAWAGDLTESRVLDLFCGMGNFSLPLACSAKEVFGTDVQRAAIRGAQRNARQNQLLNCRFSREDALAAARGLADQQEAFDLVLLDPPRQGCKAIIPYLRRLCRRSLIYVSCDPATLGRDLHSLHAQGFELRKIGGLDMFPQTHHLETIALLEKVA